MSISLLLVILAIIIWFWCSIEDLRYRELRTMVPVCLVNIIALVFIHIEYKITFFSMFNFLAGGLVFYCCELYNRLKNKTDKPLIGGADIVILPSFTGILGFSSILFYIIFLILLLLSKVNKVKNVLNIPLEVKERSNGTPLIPLMLIAFIGIMINEFL